MRFFGGSHDGEDIAVEPRPIIQLLKKEPPRRIDEPPPQHFTKETYERKEIVKTVSYPKWANQANWRPPWIEHVRYEYHFVQ